MSTTSVASTGRLSALLVALIIVASVVEFGIVRNTGIFQLSVLPALLLVLMGTLVGAFRIPPHSGGAPLLVLLVVLFAWSGLVSMAQASAGPLLVGGFFCAAVWSCYLIGLHQSEAGLRFMFKILILLCLLYFLLSFALTGFTVFRYEGLFQNPNAQGRFSGITLCFFGLLLLTGRHYLQSSGWRILLILLVAISLITLLASNSRTPFISAAAAFLAFLGLQMLRFPWLEQKVTFIVQMFIIAFFVFVIIVFADYIGALDEFARKQVHTLERGDVSQGRLEMWENALPNLTWHGLPPGDFSRLDGLHSNYLSLSMNYGIFFAILYFSVFVFILFKSSWVYWLKGCNTSRSSAALCIFFLVYSLAEQGAAIFVVWMIVWLFGVSGQSSPRIASAREADPGSIGRFGQTV